MKELINEYFENPNKEPNIELFNNLDNILNLLESGELRVSEKINNNWIVNEWIKKAILLYFRYSENTVIDAGFTKFYDKVPLQNIKNARVVPMASARRGSFIDKNVVLMPSYINIGAYVGAGTMVDTWATVGSCAQIGKNVHLSGGVGIGGVLEPLQAKPTIIEDNCFIGARSEVVEGVIVEQNSVIAMGVFLSQSTKIYDRQKDSISYGKIPEGSVVVPGTLPDSRGKCALQCAVIVKTVDSKTRQKTAINEILREYS